MTKSKEGKNLPPSRRGKRPVSFWIDRDEHKKLKLLAVERETTVQGLGEEAIKLLLERYDALAEE